MQRRRSSLPIHPARHTPGTRRPLSASLALFAAIAGSLLIPFESQASVTGQVTALCGHSAPLASGYIGFSPTPQCEGVCFSTGDSGFCNEPVDPESRIVVYGCTGKTSGSGYSCDGDHNGGVELATLSASELVFIGDYTLDPTYCTFQIDVLRPGGSDPIGLKDFIVWERDDCSPPPPSCYCPGGTDYQGNPVTLDTCNAQVCGADYQWYSCQESGWHAEGGTCGGGGGPECSCTGTDYQGHTVTVNACEQQVCGADYQWYSCEQSGWIAQGTSCPGETQNTWVAVSAGGYHTCGLRADGSVQCWGDNYWGQAPAYVPGPFVQITAGYDFSCGLSADGSVQCWGNDEYGQAPSYLPGPFTFVSGGTTHGAGVNSSGDLEYWGMMGGTLPAGTFTQVAAGGYHSCGLRTNGTLSCWGDDGHGQATPPSGNFVQISANYTTSCGLHSDGSVECWGQNTSGQTDDPPGQFSQVSTGYLVTCGVQSNSELACWGDSYFYPGVSSPPGGSYTQVSVGNQHACALSTSGEISCWGYNTYGQLDVPN